MIIGIDVEVKSLEISIIIDNGGSCGIAAYIDCIDIDFGNRRAYLIAFITFAASCQQPGC